MKLRYTPAAIVDLEEIKSYIADTLLNPDAAANLMASIAAACALQKISRRLVLNYAINCTARSTKDS